jgi:hypothetical protein
MWDPKIPMHLTKLTGNWEKKWEEKENVELSVISPTGEIED